MNLKKKPVTKDHILCDSIGMTGPESENTIESKLEVSWLWEMTKVGMTVDK